MKMFPILFAVLFTAVLLAQTPNWTGVKETNINVANAVLFNDGIDIFTNRDGNHIIVQESSSLKYYKMNLNGVAGSPITIESSAVISPSISGDADNIYIVYGMGSQLRVRRSTNGGSNWSLIYTLSLATSASWMESVVSNGNLHVTYLESSVVKYRYRDQAGSWTSEKIVSTGENGTNPRITARYDGTNNDYVYFLWQKSGTHIGNWRRYELTSNSWSDKNFGYDANVPDLVSSKPAGFRVTDSNIIIYFSYYAYDWTGAFLHYFNWTWRNISNNNYLGQAYPNVNWQMDKVYSTTTSDNLSHTAYYFNMLAGGEGGQPDMAIWRSKSTTGYPDDVIYEYLQYPYPEYGPRYLNVSSAGNEVHVIWKDQFGSNNGNNLRYKWDNQNPIAPQNLTMTSHNNHPKLVWQKNPEQDVDYYRIYRKKGSLPYTLHTTVSASLPTEYVDNEETVCNPPPGAQCQSGTVAKYYITAVDLTAKVSTPSNEVEAIVQGSDPYKISAGNSTEIVYDYELSQNYPNPFNPTTSINYQIKEKGFVSLKVFDMLGREVANLVNETQDEGQYSVVFDASNLPSGVYVYSLKVNDFIQNNKMTLLK